MASPDRETPESLPPEPPDEPPLPPEPPEEPEPEPRDEVPPPYEPPEGQAIPEEPAIPDEQPLPDAPAVDMRVEGAPKAAGTSGLAVATLIVGLLGVPVALILGFAALTRIGRTGQRGRRLAITGLVASAGWAVLLIGIAAGSLAKGGSTVAAPPPTATASGAVSVTSLRVGDCVQYPVVPSHVATVQKVPCGQQHNAEVIGRFDLSGADWPGSDAARGQASQGCEDILNKQVNRFALDPGTMLAYFYPSGSAGWQAGDRSVTCLVHQPNGAMQSRVELSSPAG